MCQGADGCSGKVCIVQPLGEWLLAVARVKLAANRHTDHWQAAVTFPKLTSL